MNCSCVFKKAMWTCARHQTTSIPLSFSCSFSILLLFLNTYVHTREYYIRRGYKNPLEDALFLQQDVFGFAKDSGTCSEAESFQSYSFSPEVSWPWNVTLCTYRCGKYYNAGTLGANTFLPKKNKCLKNTVVRTHLGSCMLLFSGESSKNLPLHVLDITGNKTGQDLKQETNTHCQVDMNGQHYYNDNAGTWENIPECHLYFNISGKKLQWISTNATLYLGRIIKLQLRNCRKANLENNDNECILFKAKGDYHYKPLGKSTVKLEPCPTPSTPQQMSTQKCPNMTMPLNSSNNVKVPLSSASPNLTALTLPPLIPSTSEQAPVVITPAKIPTTSAQTELPLMPSTSVQAPVVVTPTKNPTSAQAEGTTTPNPGGSSQENRDNTELSILVGVLTTCAIVIIISLLVVILCKKRSNNARHNSSKAANAFAANPAYEKNQKDQIIPLSSTAKKKPQVDKEYDYAVVDGVQVHTNNQEQPVYQSLERDSKNTPQIYQSLINNPDLNKPADNDDSKEYSYDHLQHLVYNPPHSKDTSDSLYNSLQKPGGDDYLEPETQISGDPSGASEPVYNVLEGPDENSAPQDNNPVYNILEDPNVSQYPQDDDPVYNVLEGPDDDYDNAPLDDDENLPASGQDNVAYSSTIDLRKAQSPSSPDYDVLEGPEGALQDSTYQSLGVRVQDDMYQPLDRTSQPIYHSLEPNDSMA